MINKRELRIGNLVKVNDTIIEVIDINVNFINEYEISSPYFEYLQPIFLTREILNKVGFADSTKHVYEYKDNSNILFDEPNDWNNPEEYPIGITGGNGNYFLGYIPHGEVIIRCLYLHQLQNIYFAITAEELDVSEILK